MKWARIQGTEPVTYAVVLDAGDEVVGSLQSFAEEVDLSAARVTAIGAFESATLGWFDPGTKDYREIPVREQVEVLSLVGDVVQYEGRPKLHLHVVVGTREGEARGGHLLEGRVRPTLEVIVSELPAALRREMDPEAGIPLVALDPAGEQ